MKEAGKKRYWQCPFYQGASYATFPFCVAHNKKGCRQDYAERQKGTPFEWETNYCNVWKILIRNPELFNLLAWQAMEWIETHASKEEKASIWEARCSYNLKQEYDLSKTPLSRR